MILDEKKIKDLLEKLKLEAVAKNPKLRTPGSEDEDIILNDIIEQYRSILELPDKNHQKELEVEEKFEREIIISAKKRRLFYDKVFNNVFTGELAFGLNLNSVADAQISKLMLFETNAKASFEAEKEEKKKAKKAEKKANAKLVEGKHNAENSENADNSENANNIQIFKEGSHQGLFGNLFGSSPDTSPTNANSPNNAKDEDMSKLTLEEKIQKMQATLDLDTLDPVKDCVKDPALAVQLFTKSLSFSPFSVAFETPFQRLHICFGYSSKNLCGGWNAEIETKKRLFVDEGAKNSKNPPPSTAIKNPKMK